MGNTDSVPVVSQVKSFVQYASGDPAGALATQENFAYNNTFPVISQIASAGYAIGGDYDKAEDLQKKFAKDMERVIDSIPVAGHIKGGVHYALGENAAGDESMKAASRSTGVVLGGVGGFAVGGPVGAVAGGVAGGAAMDGVITGSDILANGDKAKPYGYIAVGADIADAVKQDRKITASEGFDMAMLPVSDGIGGYAGGKLIGKPLGLGKAAVKTGGKGISIPVPGIKSGYKAASASGDGAGAGAIRTVITTADDTVAKVPKPLSILEQQLLDNRANQLNPNHIPSGPGRPAGYRGAGTAADLNNHANQLNLNNPAYKASRAIMDGNKYIVTNTID